LSRDEAVITRSKVWCQPDRGNVQFPEFCEESIKGETDSGGIFRDGSSFANTSLIGWEEKISFANLPFPARNKAAEFPTGSTGQKLSSARSAHGGKVVYRWSAFRHRSRYAETRRFVHHTASLPLPHVLLPSRRLSRFDSLWKSKNEFGTFLSINVIFCTYRTEDCHKCLKEHMR